VIALTATATGRVLAELTRELALDGPLVIRGSFRRDNLSFQVERIRTDEARLRRLVAALREAPVGKGRGRAIVYCATRKKTQKVAKALRAEGFGVDHYHAGRTKLARSRAQAAFASGKRPVIVATNAFGMGVDYPDVRLLVHFQTPGSVEAYYQEAGRAGRDGEASTCLLFHGPADVLTQRRLAALDRPTREQQARTDAALLAMIGYVDTLSCRQNAMAEYFTGEPEPTLCGHCDRCRAPDEAVAEQPPPPVLPALPKRGRRPRGGARGGRGGRTAVDPADIKRVLERYRQQVARRLKWKPYMVFHRRVIDAVDQARPQTLEELALIPGLGPAKVERFGEEILDLVRRAR
jgi:ATP-dependent DNA helicase RecQ